MLMAIINDKKGTAMAEVSKSGTYLRNVVCAIWYDVKGDRFLISTADKDFGPEGLKVAIPKTSKSDDHVRFAFTTKGIDPAAGS